MNIEGIKLGKQTYRIRNHDALNIVVERLVEIDPTKSPAFDPDKHDGAIRYEYREPKYHSSVESALASLVGRAAGDSGARTLSELLDEIKQFKREIRRVMSAEGI